MLSQHLKRKAATFSPNKLIQNELLVVDEGGNNTHDERTTLEHHHHHHSTPIQLPSHTQSLPTPTTKHKSASLFTGQGSRTGMLRAASTPAGLSAEENGANINNGISNTPKTVKKSKELRKNLDFATTFEEDSKINCTFFYLDIKGVLNRAYKIPATIMRRQPHPILAHKGK